MKISFNWLKQLLDFDLSEQQTSELLTEIGLEVERTETYNEIPGGLEGLIIGQVKEVLDHPNADRLKITQVDVGTGENLVIVCGAPNVAKKQKVIIALPGTKLYPINNEPFQIKKSKIRGVESYGMICAEDEIGVGTDHDGILVLEKDAEIGIQAKEYFNIQNDIIFEIGLTPNRADAMSHYGVARDLLVALKFKNKILQDAKLKSLPKIEELTFHNNSSNVEVIINDSSRCYRYSGLTIKSVSVKSSPKWLQSQLKSIGLKPINNIVDATNYVLHELGQPLHAFDLDEIKNNKIKVRCPKENTSFITLDGAERTLSGQDLMICDDQKEMCIAGVFGGENSGVTTKTKNIFIESALFDPVSIRKTAKRHGLNTDASFRYERGVDPEMVIPALIKVTQLILDISGGEISSKIVDVHPLKSNNPSFKIDFNNIRNICGFELEDQMMIKLLDLLEISTETIKQNQVKVKVPAYRNDVKREADIAEEILRIYGYNNIHIPQKLYSSPSFTPIKNPIQLQRKISNHLASLGWNEILSNSLTKRTYVDQLSSTQNLSKKHISLLNPLSGDTEVLRQSLIYNALEVLLFNHQHGEPNCKIFEWGKVYKGEGDKYIENKQLILATKGLQNAEHWFNGKQPSSFFHIKGVIESILKLLGINYITEITAPHDIWDEGLIYQSNKKDIVKIGLPNPSLLKQVGIEEKCFLAEIYWDDLIAISIADKTTFKPINKFQKVYRDLSVLIDESVTLKDLLNAIKKDKNNLLKNISLFDIYRDAEKLPNKKSYGLRFEFLHQERTLKDQEVDQIMKKIQENILSSVKGTLR